MRQWNVTFPLKWTKDGRDGTRWPIVGRAFEGRTGITLQIDAIPLNFTGKLMLFEIDEKDLKAGKTTAPQGNPPADEDVPF